MGTNLSVCGLWLRSSSKAQVHDIQCPAVVHAVFFHGRPDTVVSPFVVAGVELDVVQPPPSVLPVQSVSICPTTAYLESAQPTHLPRPPPRLQSQTGPCRRRRPALAGCSPRPRPRARPAPFAATRPRPSSRQQMHHTDYVKRRGQ